jgi:hypothetical protein
MDFFQIATFDCVVNLSADGEAAPSQHNQQEDSPAEKLHFVVAHNNFYYAPTTSRVEKKMAKSDDICQNLKTKIYSL